MKKQQTIKVLIVTASITCISYTAQAQSAGVRAATRARAPSAAEQVRRDANSINCRHQSVGRYSKWPDGKWHSLPQTVCNH